MYKHSRLGYAKHLDFILIDLVCLQLAYWIASAVYLHQSVPYLTESGALIGLGLLLTDLVVILSRNTMHNILHRGYYLEALAVVGQAVVIAALFTAFVFFFKVGERYSRMTVLITAGLYILFSYLGRLARKAYLRNNKKRKDRRSLVIIAERENIDAVMGNLERNGQGTFSFAGICLLDEDVVGQKIQGIPVVGNGETIADFVCREWVDEVFIAPITETAIVRQLADYFAQMGVTVHLALNESRAVYGQRLLLEKFNGYQVVTTTMKSATPTQLAMKRFIDICAGVVGCLITGLIVLVVGPIIKIQSPGPIFFKQDRIGKNGKHFKMYKIRSMYMDAEERKKELMKQNRVKDGLMFKLDEDPRIIGSKILEDGTYKKGIGNVIRDLSLDEFPQFINVLLGEMSLVGTRPPTVDEWEKYKYHHRSRLSIKPGITGMWQTSGRSNITDFEEVVRLDTEYIANWSIGLDIKLIFKTIAVALKRDGSM